MLQIRVTSSFRKVSLIVALWENGKFKFIELNSYKLKLNNKKEKCYAKL